MILPGISIQDIKNPERLNSQERIRERKKYFNTRKIDENNYQITKTQLWIGRIAILTLCLNGIKSSVKEIKNLM